MCSENILGKKEDSSNISRDRDSKQEHAQPRKEASVTGDKWVPGNENEKVEIQLPGKTEHWGKFKAIKEAVRDGVGWICNSRSFSKIDVRSACRILLCQRPGGAEQGGLCCGIGHCK